jgi:hypothetical protein
MDAPKPSAESNSETPTDMATDHAHCGILISGRSLLSRYAAKAQDFKADIIQRPVLLKRFAVLMVVIVVLAVMILSYLGTLNTGTVNAIPLNALAKIEAEFKPTPLQLHAEIMTQKEKVASEKARLDFLQELMQKHIGKEFIFEEGAKIDTEKTRTLVKMLTDDILRSPYEFRDAIITLEVSNESMEKSLVEKSNENEHSKGLVAVLVLQNEMLGHKKNIALKFVFILSTWLVISQTKKNIVCNFIASILLFILSTYLVLPQTK